MQVRIHDQHEPRVQQLLDAVQKVRKASKVSVVNEIIHAGLPLMEKKYAKGKSG